MADIEFTKSMVRAVVLSCKGGIPQRHFLEDYKLLTGVHLPFREFGYSSFDKFMRSLRDVVREQVSYTGEVTYFAVDDENTSHISRMIRGQRPAKKKSKASKKKPQNLYIIPHYRTKPFSPSGRGRRPRQISPRPGFKNVTRQDQDFKQNFNKEKYTSVDREVSNISNRRAEILSSGSLSITIPNEGSMSITIPNNQSRSSSEYERSRPHSSSSSDPFMSPHAGDSNGRHVANTYERRLRHSSRGSDTPSVTLDNWSFQIPSSSRQNSDTNEHLLRQSPGISSNKDSLSSEMEKRMTSNLIELINQYPTGIWLNYLSDTYKSYFDEQESLQDLLTCLHRHNDHFHIAKISEDKSIVYKKKPTLPDQSTLHTNEDKSVAYQKKPTLPEHSTLPINVSFNSYVSWLEENGKIWIQPSDHEPIIFGDEVKQIVESEGIFPMKDFRVDALCLAHYEGDDYWYRAQIVSLDSKQYSVIRYIDYGNVTKINNHELIAIPKILLAVEPLAIQCLLDGYEDESEWGEPMVQKFWSICPEDEIIIVPHSIKDGLYVIRLYAKTSDVSINDLMSSKPEPINLTEDVFYEVSVTHILTASHVVLNIIGQEFSERLTVLEEKLHKYCKNIATHHKVYNSDHRIQKGAICVAHIDTQSYNRVQVMEIHENQAECYFLDYGNVDSLILDSLVVIDPALNHLPYQGIKVTLNGLENLSGNIDALKILSKMCGLQSDEVIYAQVVERKPQLSVILHNNTGDFDININECVARECGLTLNMEYRFKQETDKSLLLLNVNENGYVDVHVTGVEDPWFIQCHLYKNIHRIDTEQQNLQDFMESSESIGPLTANDVHVGRIYAGLIYDTWYRVVIDTVDEEDVIAQSIDYGHLYNLNIKNIQRLPSTYKSLDPQACLLKLAGVRPLFGEQEWGEAAKYWLIQKLTNKNFVVKIVDFDETTRIHSVKLFDTSKPDTDVLINDELIKQHFADKF